MFDIRVLSELGHLAHRDLFHESVPFEWIDR